MAVILGALALAALAQAPAQAVPDPLHGLITSEDYPLESLDAHEQGEVFVRARIEPTGVVKCTVRKSSGYARLDAQTCKLIEQRFKPEPSRDKRGKPTALEISTSINWRIEDGPALPVNQTSRTIYSQSYGKPQTCRREGFRQGHDPETFSMDCPAGEAPRKLPQIPGAKVDFVVAHAFRIGEEPKSNVGPTGKLLGRQIAKIEVDATGKSVCKVVETTGHSGEVCSTSRPVYVPLTDASGKPMPFDAYVMFEFYLQVEKDQ